MKSKLRLGPLEGWINIKGAWPGMKFRMPLREPVRATVNIGKDIPYDHTTVRELVFECRTIDDDRAAVFEFVGIR